MGTREELEQLRAEARLQQLEARAGGQATTPATAAAQQPQEVSKPFERAGGGEVYIPGLGRVDGGRNAGKSSAFQSGLADAAIKGAMGIKQLFGGLSDENKAVLKQLKEESDADPSGFARGSGEFAGNMATAIVPGGAMTKTAGAAGLVKTLGRSAAIGAGTEAVIGVGEGDTYEQQMLSKAKSAGMAGAYGAGAAGVLGGAAKAYKGLFRANPEVEGLVRQGIVPTLQQGADSGAGRFFGGLASGSTNVRNRQELQIANAVLHRATEGNRDLPNGTGREALESAQGYVGGEYDKLFKGKRMTISPTLADEAQQAAQALNSRNQQAAQATDAGRAVSNVMGTTGDRVRMVNSKTMKENFLDPLNKAAYAEKDGETQRRILAARDVLQNKSRNAVLNPDELRRLGEVDARNFDMERIREATKGKEGEREGITLSRLATAYGKSKMAGNDTMDTLIGPALRVMGNTPTQDEARTAKQLMGRIAGPAITAAGIGGGAAAAAFGGTAGAALGVPLAAAYGISAAGQTERGAKALLGQFDSQKKLAEFLRNNANLIPALGAATGTAIEGD